MKIKKGMYFLISKLVEPLRWRFELYFAEKFDLYGSLSFYLKQKFTRKKYLKTAPVVYIYANKRNVGDYISHLGLKEIVGKDGPDLFCSPVWLKEFKAHIDYLKQYNPNVLLVIGGGGLLQPVFEPFWHVVLQSGLRFTAHGIGINKMSGRGEMKGDLFPKIAKGADHLGVRDEYTFNFLEQFAPNKLVLTACPSINYLVPRYWQSQARSSNVLLHLIHPSDVRLAGADLDTISKNLMAVAEALGLEYQEHTNMDSSHVRMLKKVSNARVIVSSRLHGCIMGFGMGIPFLPLLCDDKMKAFLTSHTEVDGVDVKQAEDASVLKHRVESLLAECSSNRSKLDVKLAENAEAGSYINSLASKIAKD